MKSIRFESSQVKSSRVESRRSSQDFKTSLAVPIAVVVVVVVVAAAIAMSSRVNWVLVLASIVVKRKREKNETKPTRMTRTTTPSPSTPTATATTTTKTAATYAGTDRWMDEHKHTHNSRKTSLFHLDRSLYSVYNLMIVSSCEQCRSCCCCHRQCQCEPTGGRTSDSQTSGSREAT